MDGHTDNRPIRSELKKKFPTNKSFPKPGQPMPPSPSEKAAYARSQLTAMRTPSRSCRTQRTQGVRRTGMMAAAFQESVLGYDKARTKDAILAFGHSERSIGDVKRFIDVYDPVKREVTQQLPQSQEK